MVGNRENLFLNEAPSNRSHPLPPAGLTAGLKLKAGLTLPDLASGCFLLSFSRRTRHTTNSLPSPSLNPVGEE